MTPQRFAELWRHRHGDEPIPDAKAYVLLDPPSRSRFSRRCKESCDDCACARGHADTADAADAEAGTWEHADDDFAERELQ